MSENFYGKFGLGFLEKIFAGCYFLYGKFLSKFLTDDFFGENFFDDFFSA